MKRTIFLVILAVVLGCPPGLRAAETVERVVAIVGSDIITLYDLDAAMAPYIGEVKASPNYEQKFKAVRTRVLDELVDDLLLKHAIETAKITVSNSELSGYLGNILSQNHVTIDVLKSELASKGVSFESYKEDLKRNIQRLKFIRQEISNRVKISEQEMRDYYQRNMSEFGSMQSAHIAQIVLPFEEAVTKEKALQMKVQADDIVKKARSGTSFAALAKEFSKGPNAESGGDLGIVNPSLLLPEVASALQKMNVGQISDAIISPAGIHIIHLIDRATATEADFDKTKGQIENKLFEERVKEELKNYLADIRRKTYVEIKN